MKYFHTQEDMISQPPARQPETASSDSEQAGSDISESSPLRKLPIEQPPTGIMSQITECLSQASKVAFRRYSRLASTMIKTHAPGKLDWETLEREYPNYLE